MQLLHQRRRALRHPTSSFPLHAAPSRHGSPSDAGHASIDPTCTGGPRRGGDAWLSKVCQSAPLEPTVAFMGGPHPAGTARLPRGGGHPVATRDDLGVSRALAAVGGAPSIVEALRGIDTLRAAASRAGAGSVPVLSHARRGPRRRARGRRCGARPRGVAPRGPASRGSSPCSTTTAPTFANTPPGHCAVALRRRLRWIRCAQRSLREGSPGCSRSVTLESWAERAPAGIRRSIERALSVAADLSARTRLVETLGLVPGRGTVRTLLAWPATAARTRRSGQQRSPPSGTSRPPTTSTTSGLSRPSPETGDRWATSLSPPSTTRAPGQRVVVRSQETVRQPRRRAAPSCSCSSTPTSTPSSRRPVVATTAASRPSSSSSATRSSSEGGPTSTDRHHLPWPPDGRPAGGGGASGLRAPLRVGAVLGSARARTPGLAVAGGGAARHPSHPPGGAPG